MLLARSASTAPHFVPEICDWALAWEPQVTETAMDGNGPEERHPANFKRRLAGGKIWLKPVYLAYALLFIIVVLLLIAALSPAGAAAALYKTCGAAPIWHG